MSLLAPAKINLSLQILGKRSDGYHELKTLMAPIALADEIEITHLHQVPTRKIQLLCNDPSLPVDETNLCIQAAHAFQKASGLEESMSITLLKRIPHGAGLGGGSSNAATVLKGMNKLFEEPLVQEELHQIAAMLGSDVPFFLDPQPQWCSGRGEELSIAASLPEWQMLLIKPPFSVATNWAYQVWGQNLSSQPADVFTIDGITLTNDLELPVFKKYLLLPVLKNWLLQRKEVRIAWMTGSGSTMVALLQKEILPDQIKELKKAITMEFGEAFWIKETQFLN